MKHGIGVLFVAAALVLLSAGSAAADPSPEEQSFSYSLVAPHPCTGELIEATVSVDITRHRHQNNIVALVDVGVTTSDGYAGTGYQTVVNSGRYNNSLNMMLNSLTDKRKIKVRVRLNESEVPSSAPFELSCVGN
ncbi:MAG: hypothetical protein WBG36_00480 [Ornithinimicrobium sp.]